MDIYVGIDGTGPGDDKVYAKEFERSFVHRLRRERPWKVERYHRGPTWHGHTTRDFADRMVAAAEKEMHGPGKSPVRLVVAGYSRGGAAAIHLCREIARHGHRVDCLLLFDAVDMTYTLEADTVPRNVSACFHARRHPSSRSRTSWGNCGVKAEDPSKTHYESRFFKCTHGGMGGVPWAFADSDGIINEALTSEQSSRLLTPLRAVPVLAPLVVSNDLHRNASRTTITIDQDKRGSSEVGTWMFGSLDRTLAAKIG